MTQEEKQLLIKDLCARLPYGVICTDLRHGDSKITEIDIESDLVYCFDFDEYAEIEHYCKPYLRPMSSMTEEEKKVLNGFAFDMGNKWFDAASNEERWLATTENNIKSTDYLYSKYLDIHGLIEKGLALEAPEGMYKTE